MYVVWEGEFSPDGDMDRYEYKVREEEIRNLISEKAYAEAVEVADTIDWSRVKSVRMLCKISDLYKINRRFQESKEILLMAYDKYPENRRIVFALCELSIILEEYVQAIEYYKEFVQLAPKDTDRYILQYKIYEAQDVSLEERAAVLEEYKRKDYKPRWGYELAELYHKMGLGSKCADECDELMATFGEGKYVIRAMELKELHEPLTTAEQAKYNNYIEERNRKIQEGAEEELPALDEEPAGMASSSLDEEDLKGAPTAELPNVSDTDEIQAKIVDVGQYNTVNLQAALAESMKDIWEGGETEEIAPSVPEENIEDNTLFVEAPLAGADFAHPSYREPQAYVQPEYSQPVYAQPVYTTPGYSDPVGPIARTVMPPVRTEADPAPQYAAHSETEFFSDTQQMPEPDPVVHGPKIDYRPGPEKAPEPEKPDLLVEQTKRIPTDTIVDYLETQRIVQEIQSSTASMQAQDDQAKQIPGAITGQLDNAGSVSTAYDQMLVEEYSGQIRLAISEVEKIEKQITGQMSIDDVLAEWEETKKENERKREDEVRQRIVQHTGSLFDEFDEDTKATLIEQLEKAFRDAILKESDGKIDDEALGKKIRKEALRTMEYMAADGMIGAGAAKVMAEVEDETPSKPVSKKKKKPVEPVEEPEEIEENAEEETAEAEEETAESVTAETETETAESDADETGEETEEETAEAEEEAEEASAAEETSEEAGTEEESEIEAEAETDETPKDSEAEAAEKPKPSGKKKHRADTESIAVSAVEEALEEDARTARKKKKTDPPAKQGHTDEEGKRVLSEEEEELFGGFLNRKGARRQIANALDRMSMAAYTGNCIVTGEEGVGTIELAKRLIRHMQITDSNFVADKVARVSGKNLNDKNLSDLLGQLDGGAIIIQSARGMKKSTVQKLITAMENENLGVLAILEDTSAGMDKIVGTLPKLGEIFNVRIDLQALDDKALVNYACEYAHSQEHSIDEFALLALHTRIGELQTNAHQVTVAEVRDLVDDAIFYADKKNPAHLFDIILHKRYDDEDMVVLREKDFMHY